MKKARQNSEWNIIFQTDLIPLNLEEKQGRALSLAPLGYWYSDQRTDPLVIDFTEILKTKGAKN